VFIPVLGPKEAEMRIIGCDLHARQQALAIVPLENLETSELMELILPS
jgi:hypothetical protein